MQSIRRLYVAKKGILLMRQSDYSLIYRKTC